jgi:chromosome segregation ATPase
MSTEYPAEAKSTECRLVKLEAGEADVAKMFRDLEARLKATFKEKDDADKNIRDLEARLKSTFKEKDDADSNFRDLEARLEAKLKKKGDADDKKIRRIAASIADRKEISREQSKLRLRPSSSS